VRHISLDLIRITEAGAISASNWIGSGNKEAVDKAATDAMRNRLNKINFAGKIVIGEGEKDRSHGMFAGECVGIQGVPFCGQDPSAGSVGEYIDTQKVRPQLYEIAIDPVDGTTQTSINGPEAISTIGISHEGCMFSSSEFYMQKIAYGAEIKSKVTLSVEDPIERTIELISKATGKKPSDIMVCILNRPRHGAVIKKLRELQVGIKLISDCDVSGSIATCLPDAGVDLMYGIGGSPEAVLSACAIKCLGGDFQAKEVKGDKQTHSWEPYGNVLGLNDLVSGHCIFVATGITNGSILRGVKRVNNRLVTNSVFMRSESGTVRWLTSHHGN